MARLRASERKRQLLETAADLFARFGYHGTTTKALADAAGITEPILYRHFKNKLDLFTTLIREISREVIAAWRERFAAAGSPEERLHVLLNANPATHERGRGVYRVIFQAMTDSAVDPAVARAIARHIRELHGVLHEELLALQKAKIVRQDQPADVLGWLLVEAAIGVGMLAPLRLGPGVSGPGAGREPDFEPTRRMLEHMLRG